MQSGTAYLQDGFWVIKPDRQQNLEHIATLNEGKLQGIPVDFEFADPRKARPRQRRLFFALLGDISFWSGTPVNWLKEYFYNQYMIKTAGKEISLADSTENTVSDAKNLIDIVIDFIFDFRVPVKRGFELLPRDEEYFQYKCLLNRQCIICGKHADVHHIDEIGMGRNRNTIDHTKHHLMALCRIHHTEYHQIGSIAFSNRYHVSTAGIRLNADTLKKIGVKGNYENNSINTPF
ncbi:putative HNHc nuclease [Limosilactobacillus reuteri]|uniref:putative HNHc nuclease n=1 Tax=Limosilactobacillus reuteri TaxID=1598 RepID=UPI001E2E2BA4|nr:putative HNHc nuclease [Limosilactobacillus reuteri]MCC4366433.1 putative HNHc nuclease [Limosilactobacillus reuteri]